MPTIAEALATGIEHHQAGRWQAAEQIYRQILTLQPNHPDAWHLLGLIAYQAGKHAIAIQYMAYAIELQPSVAAFHSNLGLSYRALGKLDQAAACWRRAVELEPDHAEALNNLGNVLLEQGNPDEALACLRHALQGKPDYAEAHYNLGNAWKHQERYAEAVLCYRRALELKPDHAEAQNNLGVALKDLGKVDEAIACFQRLLQRKPDYAEAHNNLGNALRKQEKLEAAAACYRRTIELRPDYAPAHNNLGLTLKDLGSPDMAVASCRRALELMPGYVEAHNNLGNALACQGKLEEAVACYEQALRHKADYADAHFNRSLVWLRTGDFDRGWPEYEWRWRMKEYRPPPFRQPLWDGRPPDGRTILLNAEQGFGDTLQFIRYATLVKERGARVLVQCQRPLLRLLASCPGVDEVIGQGEELPAMDFHAPLLSLPGIFRTSLKTIPADVPYLFADLALIEHWRAELEPIAGFKVGIFWRGTATDPARIIPLACFASLAGLPGVRLVSLQKGPGAEQLQDRAGRFPIAEVGSRLDDFMDTAAVLKNLDLVITCDTAVAHLAGAVGAAVWVALPFAADWRWLLDRSDSPWYPAMRLFRQKRRGDWVGVFEQIKTALARN
jgi:tetratricopeptide (TPR) repeat protein